MNKKVIVQNGRGVRHQKRLLCRFGGGPGGNFFEQEFVFGSDHQRTGGIIPFVANQLPSARHLQFGPLTSRDRIRSFLKVRFHDADAIVLLNAETFSDNALAPDENSERTGIDHLHGGWFRIIFLVAGVGSSRTGYKRYYAPSYVGDASSVSDQCHAFSPGVPMGRPSPK